MQNDIYGFLKNSRLAAGLSRKQLAEIIGCSERAVTYWESGKREMTLKHADAVCTALGVEVVIGKGK